MLVHTGPGIQLHQGDALHLLPREGTEVFHAVLTDPPYSSGGMFRADRTRSTTAKYVQTEQRLNGNMGRTAYDGDSRDQLGWLYWSALWLSEARRATVPGGVVMMFCDWRQLAAATMAIQAGGWIFRGVIPWDKTESCRPQKGRFRSQAEFVVWGSKGPMYPGPDSRCLPGFFRVDVDEVAEAFALEALADLEAEAGMRVDLLPSELRCRVTKADKEYHEAGKPVAIHRPLLEIVPAGARVLDPFCGAGPCGVACAEKGLGYTGMDLDGDNIDKAWRRIGDAQPALLAG